MQQAGDGRQLLDIARQNSNSNFDVLQKIVFRQLKDSFSPQIHFEITLQSWFNQYRDPRRTESCYVSNTVTHFITKVKQRWARLVLGWVITDHLFDKYEKCC
jgi:hypothetical protein